MKTEIIEGFENKDLTCYVWDDVKNPKAVIQIIHGMKEHAKRYDNFAKFLNKNGYIAFASDLRGHGETCGDSKFLGHTNGDIFKESVSDQVILTEKLIKRFDLPVYVVGHSYGSFIAQRYAQICNLSNKVVLCGSAYTKTTEMFFGYIVSLLTAIFKGNHAKAKMIEHFSFDVYEKNFKNNNWLTQDEEIFKQYKLDPYCGIMFPVCFYKSFFKNLLQNYKDLKLIVPEKQIFIISGENDPVNKNGKLAQKLYNVYKKNNIKCNIKLYKNGRHEILNETFKEDVFLDIISFFEK